MIYSSIYTRFRDCYMPTWGPPKWIPEWVTDDHLKSFILYYDEKDKQSAAIKLLYARDPVNIALDTSASKNAFHHAFPNEPKGKSYIKQAHKLGNRLPPNIAVYCNTPILNINAPGITEDTSNIKDASLFRNIHVINLIGYGFDTMEQPDAKFFCENVSNNAIIRDKKSKKKYEDHVRLIFRKLFHCAEQHQFHRIMVAEVGCGAFAGNENQEYATHVFYKILSEELRQTQTSFEFGLLGHPTVNTDKMLKQIVNKTKKHTFFKGVHLIPNIIFEMSESELNTTLFVNAWDPHSAVGNGNWNDRSLDGFFGRSSAMAVICHPYINYHLTKTKLQNHIIAVPNELSHSSNIDTDTDHISIVTTYGTQTTNERYALWVSQFQSIQIEDYTTIKTPQQLLIYVAMKSNGNVKALYDENGLEWNASIEFDMNGNLYYISSNGSPKKITFIPLFKTTVKHQKNKNKKSIKQSHTDSTFTLSTCNCLYARNINATSSKDLCVYETECVERSYNAISNGYKGKPVTKKHLYWPTRIVSLANNIKHSGLSPDIMLLQETTPQMLTQILNQMNHQYQFARSTYGMGERNDGYCYVVWRTDVFEQRNKEVVAIAPTYNTRFVAVRLVDKNSGREVAILSTHLPSDGSGNIFNILKSISHWKLPKIVGGDFNIGYGNFDKNGFKNISGNELTFYNQEDAKYDWVIGTGVTSSDISVNAFNETQGRWPNEYEGSDHTAIRMNIHVI